MSKVEVLVTTMHRSDFSLYENMNLQTDAVLANQTDHDGYEEKEINGNRVRMVSTVTRGLSRNRNIAMAHSRQGENYVLFADDDLLLADDYERMILDEFEAHPEAEAIKFNLHSISKKRKIAMRRIEKFEKATQRNMSAGTVNGLVIKTEVLRRINIHFHEFFGTGTENYCGEDTIFLMDLIKKKVKLYRSPIDIAGVDSSESTWYEGHNERFFKTAGMVIGTIHPILAYVIVLRSARKFSKRKSVNKSFFEVLKCYYEGIRKHV